MDIKDFYTLGSRLVSSTFQASPIGLRIGEKSGDLPDHLKLLLSDYEDFSFPIVFKQEYGKKLQDILDTGHANLFLISDRMKTLLEDHGFTGWKTFVVKIYDKRNNEIDGYHGLSVTGRCGLIDFRKSEIIEKRSIPDGPLVRLYKGLPVGLDKWDGSDFFMAERYYGIMIARKVADVLRKNKLTNVYIRNLSEIETYVDFAPKYDLE